MKKIISLCCLIVLLVFCLCSCSTSKSFTYDIETGESVTIKLDTTNSEYDIKADGSTFELYNGEQLIAKGCFIAYLDFNKYKEKVNEDEHAEIVEETDTKIIYLYNDEKLSEYDMILCVSEKTGVIIGSILDKNVTKSIAADALSRLTFTIVE